MTSQTRSTNTAGSASKSEREAVPRISVVICTHNRGEYLAGAVQSVRNQPLDLALYEVIIVDNNETPDPQTQAVAEQYGARYALEPSLGLSHARNRGVKLARGEYVAFLDDDAQAVSNWLRSALDVIEHCRPAALGGMALPLYTEEAPKPKWFEDRFIVEGYWGKQARSLAANEYVYGMNMFWRRDVLNALGGFDPAYGMMGKKIAYAEETILQIRLRARMPEELIYYHPAVTVHHVVRAEKMQWAWIVRQRFARGQYSFRARYERKGRKQRSTSRRALIIAKSALRIVLKGAQLGILITIGAWRRNRAIYPHARTFIYERGLRPLRAIGALYEKARLMLTDVNPPDQTPQPRASSRLRSGEVASSK